MKILFVLLLGALTAGAVEIQPKVFPCQDYALACVWELVGSQGSNLHSDVIFCGNWENGYPEPAYRDAHKFCAEHQKSPGKLCRYKACYTENTWPQYKPN